MVTAPLRAPAFLQVSGYGGGGGGWGAGGWGGGDKNVIHTWSMPKTLVFTAFSPLCTTYCTRIWNKQIYHKRPCLSRPCPKHWSLQRFMPKSTGIYSILTYCTEKVEGENLSQASMPFATMPKKHWYLQRFMPKKLGCTALPCKQKTLNIKPLTRPSNPKSFKLSHTSSKTLSKNKVLFCSLF